MFSYVNVNLILSVCSMRLMIQLGEKQQKPTNQTNKQIIEFVLDMQHGPKIVKFVGTVWFTYVFVLK